MPEVKVILWDFYKFVDRDQQFVLFDVWQLNFNRRENGEVLQHDEYDTSSSEETSRRTQRLQEEKVGELKEQKDRQHLPWKKHRCEYKYGYKMIRRLSVLIIR